MQIKRAHKKKYVTKYQYSTTKLSMRHLVTMTTWQDRYVPYVESAQQNDFAVMRCSCG